MSVSKTLGFSLRSSRYITAHYQYYLRSISLFLGAIFAHATAARNQRNPVWSSVT
eukprot:IDg2849t1